MSKKKKGAVPRLRFPEFRNAGPWEVKALAEVLEEHGEKSNGTEEVYSVSVHKGLVNQIEHLGRNFAAQNTDHYNRVFPGDIVYTKSPTGDFPYGIIKQNKSGQTVIVSPLYGVFRPQNYAIGVLLDAFFESPSCAKIFLEPLVQKGAKNTINISNSRFLSGTLPLTQEPREQQKIADCLSSLDEVIELEAKRLDALKAHKKGLLQQLFPREGETTPRLRFPEFRNAGEWEVRPLGTFVRHTAGNPNLIKGRLHPEPAPRRFPGFSASGQDVWLDDFEHSGHAVVVSAVGARCGRCFMAKGKWSAIANTHILFPKERRIDVRFLYAIVTRNGFWITSGSGQPFVKVRESLSQRLPLPSLEEQQKIADCLSSLDELIEVEAKRLDALKRHKKGLLQQLFPQEVE